MIKQSTEQVFEKYRQLHAFVVPLEPQLREALAMLECSFRAGGKLLVCGNGGSCADADHIVGELVKSFRVQRPLDTHARHLLAGHEGNLADKLQGGLPAINLGAQTALMTAMLNDVGAEYIYAQEVMAYGQPGDVLLGISTSGNSRNILYAGATAKTRGVKTLALTGRKGGKVKECFDLALCAPADSTEDIQDIHSTLYHILCAALECQFWGE